MTDLATPDDIAEASTPSSSLETDAQTSVIEPEVQWAPAEPAPRKKRKLWLWIGIPSALVLGGAAAASLVLIAPGTSVAGVPVGFLTAGAASDAIAQRLADTQITLGEDGPTVSGADLGATVDADALAAAAFDERPLWNVTQWFGDPVDAPVAIDTDTATQELQESLPVAFVAPTPATVTFTDGTYTVTPAVDGSGVDLDALTNSLHDAFAAGDNTVTVDVSPTSVPAAATTEAAQSAADQLNAMVENIGFYVGDERTVPVDAETAADWITVDAAEDGTFSITADAAKIQTAVDGLPDQINQTAVNGSAITNSAGTILETLTPSRDGRELGDTSAVAGDFADQLSRGDAVYELPVTVTPATVEKKMRQIEVDLSAQRVYLKENGQVVDSWLVSTGRPGGSVTYTGNYTINAHVRSQTMTGTVLDDPNRRRYEIDNVQWVMYFNGDQAFHGVYWHSDYLRGKPNSNGCVGMSNERAQQLYMFAAQGTEVSIYGTTPGS